MNSIAQRYSHASQNDIVKEINSVHESLSSSSNIPQLELAPSIAIPPISQPTDFLRAHTDDSVNPDCKIKIAHGTTTLAFRFQGGIIVAVDSRATAGNWIASQTVNKVIRINPFYWGLWLVVLLIVNFGKLG